MLLSEYASGDAAGERVRLGKPHHPLSPLPRCPPPHPPPPPFSPFTHPSPPHPPLTLPQSRRFLLCPCANPSPLLFQILEDSPRFIAGRANAAVRRYLDDLLPPLAGAMVKYASTNEYSWAAPGHQGGVAFTKNRTYTPRLDRGGGGGRGGRGYATFINQRIRPMEG